MPVSWHKLVAALLLTCLLAGCGGSARAVKPLGRNWLTTKADVVEAAQRELALGSSSEQIEAFYREHEISYEFDGFGNARYEAVIRNVCCFLDHAIRVDFEVDAQGRLVRRSIEDSYTFL